MGLAVVNSRAIDDTTLTLAASGWTYDATFVLYDHQTESLWFPQQNGHDEPGLLSIGGFHAGRTLQEFPLELTTWQDWLARHPGSPILR
jgi:hypothetical protein